MEKSSDLNDAGAGNCRDGEASARREKTRTRTRTRTRSE